MTRPTLIEKNNIPPSWVTSSKSFCRVILALFAIVAASAPLQAQETTPTPVIILNHSQGNFFVFASDLPFKVLKEEQDVSWLEVDPLEGEKIAHRIVQVKSNPEGLADGIYYTAIRVTLVTSTGADHILIPVALRVGEEFEKESAPPVDLDTVIPQDYIRLRVDDPETDIRFILTPGGHYIFEVIDRQKERIKLEQLSVSPPRELLQQYQVPAGLTESYQIVFPWMCLEYPCGSTTEADIADVEPNLDAVNHISYERHTMSWGQWGVHNVGDPAPWAMDVGLGTWPMVTGGYNPPSASIQAMWANRATIVDQMVTEATENGYRGYCIDVEGHADTSTKATFIDLMDYFADELHAHGFQLMVAHATWSTIAPIEDLATTSVDYVATMDPYTSLWYDYIPANYGAIEPPRLIWAFTWDRVSTSTQLQMWEWMEAQGYNVGVTGAAAWRTPLMPPHPDNDVDYYQGFRDYYPVDAGSDECTATVGSDRWKGEYYGNKGLGGAPLMVRDDGNGFLNFDWSLGSPGSPCGLGVDQFSVRWTRSVYFPQGTHRFTVTSDDGFRLYIDGALRLERWFDQGSTTYTVDVSLAAGNHTIVLEYYENGGYAVARLSWGDVSAPSNNWAFPVGDAATGNGWYVSNPLGNSWYSSQNNRWYRGHLGEDWFQNDGDSLGEPVYAAAAGRIITVLNNCGNYVDVVIIEHKVNGINEPIYSFYGHLEADGYVEEGDSVTQRQQIGVIGDPRPDFAPHLHFEIKNRTALVNPPFSGCSDTANSVYISAGYSGLSDDYDGGDFYDPSGGVAGNRFYHPTRFIENHSDGSPGPTDCSSFVSDLNYPDGTMVSPGESFTKGWSLSNCGDSTWSAAGGYRAVRVGGNYGPTSFDVPTVEPGATGDTWVGITAPTIAGSHRATYLLEGPVGRFGDPFWIEIVVGEEPTTNCSSFVSDLNYPDGTEVSPGQTINKGWRLSNCGDTTWSTAGGYRAVRTGGSYGPTSFDVPSVGPGQNGHLYANITVPTTPGTHRATYKLEGPGGTFGDPFWIEIRVRETQTIITVDDGDAGFLLFGPSQYWHRESIGYGADMYWTYVNGNIVSNKVQWHPNLTRAGNYQVRVFIPYDHATTRSARYTIKADGATYTATVDQNIYYDEWITLGTFYFKSSNDGSEYIELTDATGEPGSSYRKIGFDAARWVNQ